MESVAAWFQDTLLPWGEVGILGLSALDASFIPMPQIIDLAVMGACALRPERALPFAAAATVGSTAGTVVITAIARGGRMVSRIGANRLAWAEDLLERRGLLALLVAALLPAPFPFKVVIIAAGYLRIPWPTLIVGVGLGRAARFGSQALIAALWGEAIIAQVQAHGPLVALLVAVVALLVGAAYYRWSRSTAD